MPTRHLVLAFALPFAMLGAAQAGGDRLQPAQAYRIDLGKVSGVAYYTVEQDGFHVVTTLAQGEDGTPVRVVSVLAPGQSVVVSTPNEAGRSHTVVEIRRQSDALLVREIAEVTN